VFASVASVVLIFCIARRLFGPDAAIIAGVLAATFPLTIRYASILVPEPIAELYIIGAILLYVSTARTKPLLSGAWIGLLLGMAYLTEEIAAFIGIAVLIETALRREWRLLAAIVSAGFAVFAGEHAYYWLATGDPLFRLHSLAHHNAIQTPLRAMSSPSYRLFHRMPSLMLLPNIHFGLHSLAGVLAGAMTLFLLPSHKTRLLLLWFAIPALYLNFGTSSLTHFTLLPIADRYLEPL
jgi:hypothetical protein